jgi:thioredoxin reductase (NADPH)
VAEHYQDAVAFPALTQAQLAALGTCPFTTPRRYRDGEKLFEVGERDTNFFVVKSGQVEILDESGDTPKTIRIHQVGEFTGEVAQLTGRLTLVSGVARGDTEVYVVTTQALRELMNAHPDLGDLILQAFIARRQQLRESGQFTGLRVIGSRFSTDTFRIRDFLARNRVPFTWLDLENDSQVALLLKNFGVSEADTPVVIWGRKVILRNPSNVELANTMGFRRPAEQTVYDLVIVGAGPAGLAAAVYGGSEGLTTMVLERTGPGGQAGRSMRIENYLGFPTGITGNELAERAVMQALKFGARIDVPSCVTSLTFDQTYALLHLDNGETVTTKCLLIATGADYRLLGVDGCTQFEGRGVYYAATPNETAMCKGKDVIVVGGGNSAGQAAVFLASLAHRVYLLVRSESLYKNMSAYLAQRIEKTPNIEICLNTEVQRMAGDTHLGDVVIVNSKTRQERTLNIQALFSFIGAVPRTDWLPAEIERDPKQFVCTGPALGQSPHWNLPRQPFLLETSHPGVFAAGDVRSGSVKRVASAVGEGAMVVQFVHEYLKKF